MKLLLKCLLLSVTTLISQTVFATSYGVSTSTTFKATGCNTIYCTSTIDDYIYTKDGGLGTVSSSTVTNGGNDQGQAVLDSSNGAPILKTYATAANHAYSNGSAQGIQFYQYTGTEAFTLELTASYHANMSGDGAYFSGASALLKADANTEALNAFNDAYPWFDDYLLEGPYSYGDEYDYDSAQISHQSGEQYITLSLSLDLNPLDTFYLWGEMNATALSGATVNALNTGTFSFNTTDLAVLGSTAAPAVSAVPVPAALWLFFPTLMGLLGLRRKTV